MYDRSLSSFAMLCYQRHQLRPLPPPEVKSSTFSPFPFLAEAAGGGTWEAPALPVAVVTQELPSLPALALPSPVAAIAQRLPPATAALLEAGVKLGGLEAVAEPPGPAPHAPPAALPGRPADSLGFAPHAPCNCSCWLVWGGIEPRVGPVAANPILAIRAKEGAFALPAGNGAKKPSWSIKRKPKGTVPMSYKSTGQGAIQ